MALNFLFSFRYLKTIKYFGFKIELFHLLKLQKYTKAQITIHTYKISYDFDFFVMFSHI